MNDTRMDGFYSVHPPEDDHGNPELWAAIQAARGALMAVLENGEDPQADERYQALERHVTEIKQRLGVDR